MGLVQQRLLVLGFPQLLHSWMLLLHSWMLLLLLPWVSPNTPCEREEWVLPLPAGDLCGAASSHRRCLNFHEPAAAGTWPWH